MTQQLNATRMDGIVSLPRRKTQEQSVESEWAIIFLLVTTASQSNDSVIRVRHITIVAKVSSSVCVGFVALFSKARAFQ